MTVLYTFVSVHHMLRAEKILGEVGIALQVMPTPRSISTSCGISITIPSEQTEAAEQHMVEAGVQMAGRYENWENIKGNGE